MKRRRTRSRKRPYRKKTYRKKTYRKKTYRKKRGHTKRRLKGGAEREEGGIPPRGEQPPAAYLRNSFHSGDKQQLELITNTYGFFGKMEHKKDQILFPGMESCSGVIVVLINNDTSEELFFGYHWPPNISGDLDHRNNDNDFINLIEENKGDSDYFIIVSMGFEDITMEQAELKGKIETTTTLKARTDKSYIINNNPKGIQFDQRYIEQTTLDKDWKVISTSTKELVLIGFMNIALGKYGWIIKQDDKQIQFIL